MAMAARTTAVVSFAICFIFGVRCSWRGAVANGGGSWGGCVLKYAVPICRLEHLLPNAHRHLEEAVGDGDARHGVGRSSKLVWARRPRHRFQQRSCVFMAAISTAMVLPTGQVGDFLL